MIITQSIVNLEDLDILDTSIRYNLSINYFQNSTLVSKVLATQTIYKADLKDRSKDSLLKVILDQYKDEDLIVYTDKFSISLEKYEYLTSNNL